MPNETGCTQAPGSIIGTGFAFDPHDTEGPAQILFLYDDLNEGIFEPNDIILEYRGQEVHTGEELFQLIQTLPDVNPGDTIPMRLLRGGGDFIAEPVADIQPQQIPAPGVWQKCQLTKCQKIPIFGLFGGGSQTCACQDAYVWDCYHRMYFDPGPHKCEDINDCRYHWIYYQCYNKRVDGTILNECITPEGTPVGK